MPRRTPKSKSPVRAAARPPRARAARGYDRARAEAYWGRERRRLRDEFRIVLSAGEPDHVNAAYHLWELSTLVAALRPARGLRVLDLACGLGRVSAPLALAGATVIGVDNAFAMARAARAKTERLARAKKVRARTGWAQGFSDALPFADGAFDAVLCLGLLEHLPAWLQAATLAECLRVLKPGGALYLVLNNNRSLLLAAGGDNRHRRARQLPNGYYCGLVDREKLLRDVARKGARVDALGSNGHYAVLRHALHGRALARTHRTQAAPAFAAATERDLAEPAQGAFGVACADHFFYRITRRARATVATSPRRPVRARAAAAPPSARPPAAAGPATAAPAPVAPLRPAAGPQPIARATFESRLRALKAGGVGPGLPRRRADRWIVMHAAWSALPEADLSEHDLNRLLRAWLADAGPRVTLDHVSLRRAMVDEGFLERDPAGTRYRRSRAHERRVVFTP